MLQVTNLSYRIGGKPILERVNATVQAGWKVGVVGPNGAGKSTLFKLIAGELAADDGAISLHPQATMGWVRQDIPSDDTPLLDVVLAADTERTRLLAEAETEQDGDRLGEIYERLTDIDAYSAPARASTVLAGLGFKEDQLQEPISAFSGGWRMRVALAGALFRQPDLLLLDEPTNHLDLEAIMWLEGYLASYPKTLLVISHDRTLLNTCIDHVLHVENRQVTAYTGDYDTFERERAERDANQQKLHERQLAQRAHLQAFVDRFRAKASKAKQAQSRLKMIEKMDIVEAVLASRAVNFAFPAPTDLSPPLLTLDRVAVGYGQTPVLQGLNLQLDPEDRVALLGANGNGKSTLIKLLAGKLAPLGGDVRRHPKLGIGYFAQHQAEELDLTMSPVQTMARLMEGQPESAVRAKLGRFGFSKPLADNPIGTLSGGEKARLLFALMSLASPQLLLLDEPTNHLDMESREALIQALNAYEGAVVIVSHDPAMVERVATQLWLVAEGGVQPFEGTLADYRQHVIQQRRAERQGGVKAAQTSKARQNPALAKAVKEAETALVKQEKRVRQMEAKLAAADPAELAHLGQRLQAEQENLAAAEGALLAAMTAMEAAG